MKKLSPEIAPCRIICLYRISIFDRVSFKNQDDIFAQLFAIIEKRKTASPEDSYVARLLSNSTEKICGKITEEAGEVCEAAGEADKGYLVYEICDLLFHTFVLAGAKNILLSDIQKELHRRFDTSGLEEKRRRTKE